MNETFSEYNKLVNKTPKVIVRRFDNNKGMRFYYWFDKSYEIKTEPNICTGIGITSLLSAVMPESPFLTQWKVNKGEDWRDALNLTAEYGTKFHTIIPKWHEGNQTEVAALIMEAESICEKGGVNTDMPAKDLLSYMAFAEEYKVKPLLLEAVLIGEMLPTGEHYCMTIDCLAEVEVMEGRGKEKHPVKKTALIDFKTNFAGKDSKSFYDSHHYQLIAAKRAVFYNFGIQVDMICNWSPLNWRTEPTFTLKTWDTTEQDNLLFDNYVNTARLMGILKPSGRKLVISGYENSKQFEYVSYEDFIRRNLIMTP